MVTATTGRARIDIAAPATRVYDVVSDVTRMGQWSPECYQCEWIDGEIGPVVGAWFRGHNRVGPVRWSTTAIVVTAERGLEFAFTIIHSNGREETAGATASNPHPVERC